MQRVSAAYRAEMKSPLRSQGYVKITFGLIDVDAAPDAGFSDNSREYFSRTDTLAKEDGVPEATYATFEPGRMKLDGGQRVPSRLYPMAQGYVSAELSGGDGVYRKQPTITAAFTRPHRTKGLTFTFDRSTGDCPAELRILTYRGGAVVTDYTELGIADAEWAVKRDFPDFDRLELRFVRSGKPYRRARLQQIVFGLGIVFDNSTLQSITAVADIDPITRRLPVNTLEFSIINLSGMYNPDSPSGVWEAIEQQSPVRVGYGQRITTGLDWGDVYAQSWEDMEPADWRTVHEGGGYTEWVKLGRYLLDSRPTADGDIVKFKCRDALACLTDIYYKGTYRPEGASLYDLAVEVLREARLPDIYEGRTEYFVDESLKNIRTKSPLPMKKHNECLQLIAHAAQCILYTDRDGVIRMEPNHDFRHDFCVDFDTAAQRPKVEKLPTLREVRVKVTDWRTKPEREELYEAVCPTLSGSFRVEYSPAADIIATATNGAAVEFIAYTRSAVVTLTGSGETELTITGQKLELFSSDITIAVPGSDANGEAETLDNELVSDASTARALGEAARDYLLCRSTYTEDYRGNPELEANDLIWMQSQFDPKFRARVLKHTLKFNGALSGNLIVKRTNL